MTADLLFFAAHLALAALGAGIAFHPSVRSLSAASRFSLSLCAGAVALTIEATLFSLVGIAWSLPGLFFPPVLVSAACALRWRRLPFEPPRPPAVRRSVAVWSVLACGTALLYLTLCFSLSAATSTDFLFFWGVKAARFAAHRGISAEFLRSPFAFHTVPDYPPLVPIVQAWGCLAAGRMPWRLAPMTSTIWIVAAIPVLFDRCRRRLTDDGAAALAGCWTAAMSVSMAYSMSGGNAEAPLLCFESVALAWLLTETGPWESRLVPVLALCGAALTKVEGSIAVVLVAAGAAALEKERPLWRRLTRSLPLILWPAAAVGVWLLYQRSRGLPVGYRPHGELLLLYPDNLPAILKAMLGALDAGCLWLPWILAVLLLARHAPAWRGAAPALALAAGLMLFFVFDYLHDKDDPTERIGWTTPRVTQPALSAAILGAGMLSLGSGRRRGGDSPP